jgi:hypothetical protein
LEIQRSGEENEIAVVILLTASIDSAYLFSQCATGATHRTTVSVQTSSEHQHAWLIDGYMECRNPAISRFHIAVDEPDFG